MNFIGIDPGRKGGIAWISGENLRCWEMPPEQNRGIDLMGIDGIISLCLQVDEFGCGNSPIEYHTGLEWNTARPDNVPDNAFRSGIQAGQLYAMFYAKGFTVDLIPPNTWMQKLGLPGKDGDFELKQRIELVTREFPEAAKLFTGPRGGIHDGILEAICIAVYMRVYYSTPLGKKVGPRKPTFRGIEP